MIKVLVGLFVLALALTPIALSVYGLVLAFKASIALGIIALIVEPSPLIFGAVMFFGDVNLPVKIIEYFSK